MTKLGRFYRGIWPEYPVIVPTIGMMVRYPSNGGRIIRGQIETISRETVYFKGGTWAYTHEISEDRD